MKHNLLIVEDNADIASLIQLHAKDIDCSSDIASDGKQALQMFKQNDYQLVILDLMLPEVDGLEVCRQLRADASYVPILMLTSKSSELDRVRERQCARRRIAAASEGQVQIKDLGRLVQRMRQPGRGHGTPGEHVAREVPLEVGLCLLREIQAVDAEHPHLARRGMPTVTGE